MLGVKIRKLSEKDILPAITLYAHSCRYLEYFQKMFGVTDCEQNIIESFTPDVIAAIRTGLCIGAFKNNELIGVIFSVDWHRYFTEEFALFEHMFNSELPETKDMIEHLKQFESAYFIFAIGVADGFRCQGIATSMLKHFLVIKPKRCSIATDCIYEYAQSLWLSNKFTFVQLPSVRLAVRCD